uniref:Uncharacterized protein n=1 Tax=Chlamydomonas leiostraca TaxID=1034604 RepID=A0A7S0RUG7_9CHLO|mmetsp:Transcript_31989/g.81317  ORF Transcript_31989/g.81317 Transcript_31989/m.81317 type:complete len:115 (+) Transcript_31989:155-499(+)
MQMSMRGTCPMQPRMVPVNMPPVNKQATHQGPAPHRGQGVVGVQTDKTQQDTCSQVRQLQALLDQLLCSRCPRKCSSSNHQASQEHSCSMAIMQVVMRSISEARQQLLEAAMQG